MTGKRTMWASMALGLLVALGGAAGAGADGPATRPAPEVSPPAAKLLDQIKSAYGSLKSLDVTGTVDGQFNIDGQQTNKHAQFSGCFQAGGKFRSEVKGDVVVGFTGEKQFVFIPSKNSYWLFDAPKGKADLNSIDDNIASLLMLQNIPLALALAPDAAQCLCDGPDKIALGDPVAIGDVNYSSLLLFSPGQDCTLLFDPQTHLLSRAVINQRKLAAQMGAGDVQSAQITVEIHNVADAKLDDSRFAWSPPPEAMERHLEVAGGAPAGSASDLKGHAAPAFSLETLDGKKVSSDDLKGSIYILDFWATWCGPCVASLPQLDKIYQDFNGAGLKVFAVNQDEDKATVQKFVDARKLTIPALLDPQSKVGQAYGANAIPETVLVGKDGKVLEVFIGAGQDEEIRKQVDAALKNK